MWGRVVVVLGTVPQVSQNQSFALKPNYNILSMYPYRVCVYVILIRLSMYILLLL